MSLENRNLSRAFSEAISQRMQGAVRQPKSLDQDNRQFQIDPSKMAPEEGPLSIYKL